MLRSNNRTSWASHRVNNSFFVSLLVEWKLYVMMDLNGRQSGPKCRRGSQPEFVALSSFDVIHVKVQHNVALSGVQTSPDSFLKISSADFFFKKKGVRFSNRQDTRQHLDISQSVVSWKITNARSGFTLKRTKKEKIRLRCRLYVKRRSQKWNFFSFRFKPSDDGLKSKSSVLTLLQRAAAKFIPCTFHFFRRKNKSKLRLEDFLFGVLFWFSFCAFIFTKSSANAMRF